MAFDTASAYESRKKKRNNDLEILSMSAASDSMRDFSESSAFDTAAYYNATRLNDSLNKLSTRISGKYDEINDYLGSEKWQEKENRNYYNSSLNNISKDTDKLINTLKSNRYIYNRIYGEDKISELINSLGTASSDLKTAVSAINEKNKYFEQWETEDDYNKYKIGWLDPEAEVTTENAAARQSYYAANEEKINELNKQRSEIVSKILPHRGGVPFWDKEGKAELDKLHDNLDIINEQIDTLKAENQRYLDLQNTIDSKYKLTENSDFAEVSENRDFKNPTREEMYKYDVAHSGVSLDKYGNTVNGLGETVDDEWFDEKLNIDRLGLYLSAGEEEKTEAFGILSGAAAGGHIDTWAESIKDGIDGSWDELDENEINIYYYLLNTEGLESADKFLDDMKTELNRRSAERSRKEISNAGALEKIALNIASVPASVIGGVPAFIEDTANKLQGKRINPYSPAHSLINYTQNVRSSTAEDIDEWSGGKNLFGFSLGDAYQAGMSGADFLASAALHIPPNVYGAFMGMGAASSEARRLYETGASDEQIALGGGLAGAAEMIFEKISLDKFTENILNAPIKTKAQMVKNALLQGGVEASEETATQIANNLSDLLVMGTRSNIQQKIKEYTESGDSEAAATVKALFDGVYESGMGGFLAGLMTGGLGSAAGYSNYLSEAKRNGGDIRSQGNINSLVNLAREITAAENNEKLSSLTDKVQSNATDKNVGLLYEGVRTAQAERLNQSERQAVRDAIKSETESRGIKNAGEAAEVIYKAMYGQLSAKESRIFENAGGRDILNKILNSKDTEADARNNAIENTGKNIRAAELTGKRSDSARLKMPESRFEVNPDGETINTKTDKPVSITGIASVKDGKMLLKTESGETVDAADVSFADEGEALIYSVMLDMGVGAGAAESLIKNFDPQGNISAVDYALGIEEAYRYGRYHIPVREMSLDGFSAVLTEQQKMHAYNLGAARSEAETAARQARVNEVISTDENKQNNSELDREYSKRKKSNNKMQLREEFRKEYDSWDKKDPRIKFNVGTTSDILMKLGVGNKSIIWDSSKIIKIKSKHSEMTDEIIKQVPYIIENPIIVMRSKSADSRLTMFGEVFAGNKPVLAVIELLPTGKNGYALDAIKIASAYGKDNAQKFMSSSDILYIDSNKKRVSEWENRTGLLLPVGKSIANSIDSIPNFAEKVNIKENTAENNSAKKYSVREEFAGEIDAWDGKSDKTFYIGNTSEALKSIGVKESNIIWRSRKIGAILNKHSGMTRNVIKQVPYILENPVIILKSQNSDSRIVIFGEITDVNGAPVTVVLELQPTNKGGQILNMSVVASAYGKDSNPAGFILNSEIIYIDENRAKNWLQGLGLQLSSDTTVSDSIGSITYPDGKVKITSTPANKYIRKIGKNVKLMARGSTDTAGGRVHINVSVSSATERQKASVAAIGRIVSGVTHNNVYIYESVEKDGRRVFKNDTAGYKAGETAPNGFYVSDTGEIYIDLNAGNSGEGLMLFTMAHEITHFIRQWSPAKFEKLAKFLFEQYGEKGVSVDALIKEQIAKAKRNGRDISYDEAYEEVVASSMEGMLADGKVFEKLALLKERDAGLVEKIKSIIQSLINRIKKAYAGLTHESREGKLVAGMLASAEKMRDLFTDALIDAGETFQNTDVQKDTDVSEKVQYSLREDVEQEIEKVLSDKTYSGEIKLTDSSPSILLGQKGVRNLPMVMKATHIRENILTREEAKNNGFTVRTNVNYHGLGKELFLKVINDLDNVKEAYRGTPNADNSTRRENYFLLISQYKDNGGNIINVPVYINEKGLYNRIFIDTNKIATVFGRNELRKYLNRQLEKGNIVRIKKRSNPISESTLTVNADYEKITSTDYTISQNDTESQDYSMQENKKHSDRDYTYEALTAKPDMKVTVLDGKVPTSRADVVAEAKKNAASVGKRNSDGSVSVFVDDIDTDILLGTDGLRHGLRRVTDMGNEPNYIVTMKAGEIIKNSVKINEMIPSKKDASGAYILIGTARNTEGDTYIVRSVVNKFKNELVSLDVLYAINAKKEELGATKSPRFTEKPLSLPNSTISISDLLDLVNKYFPDVLSESVLRHYGYDERPTGEIGKDVLFSDRDPDAVSNRTLLSRALESAAQNEIELKRLREYQSKAALIDGEQKKLSDLRSQIRELSFAKGKRDMAKLAALKEEAAKSAKRLDIYDRQLLRLEAAKPLKELLEREKTAAEKRQKLRDAENLRAYREKALEKQQEITEKYRESRRKAVESRRRTVERNKIKRVIKRLDALLNRGNREKNVKIGLRDTVASALSAAEILFSDSISNADIVRRGPESATAEEIQLLEKYSKLLDERDTYEERIAGLEENGTGGEKADELGSMIKKLDTRIKKLDKQLTEFFETEREKLNRATAEDVLSGLAEAYRGLRNSGDEYIRNAYDSGVQERLDGLKDSIGGTVVRDMNLAQLEEVYSAFRMVEHTVRTANSLFREGRTEDLKAAVEAVQGEIRKTVRSDRKDPSAALDSRLETARSFSWNELKPYYAFERLGSETYTGLFWDVIKGESIYASDIDEANIYIAELMEKYGYKQWDTATATVFKTPSGQDFRLTLEDMLSVYAYSKREQAYKHMTEGGFTFDRGSTYRDKKTGLMKKHRTVTEAYRLNDELIGKIIDTLTDEQKQFADGMLEYLKVMADKGNEVSRKLYGIDLFTEKAYFPLKSERDYRSADEQTLGGVQLQSSLKNSGMTRQTVPGANNPIVLSGFTDVIINHIDSMAKYHGLVLPIENLRRVFDNVARNESGNYVSTKALIKTAYGASAEKYFNRYISDLNGGIMPGDIQSPLMNMFSRMKSTAVAANLSVMIQQPFAIIRAFAEINPKYFVPLTDSGAGSTEMRSQWEELKRYAPIAVIKEIGGFDVSSGRAGNEYIAAAQRRKGTSGLLKNISSFAMKGAETGDKIGWSAIWRAVKKETADNQELTPGTEEFYKAAGKRFTEIVVKTQVYDSVNSRSGYMRSQSDLMKFATSFMGEPTAIYNMAYSANLNFKRALRDGGKAAVGKASIRLLRVSGALLLSMTFNNIFKSLVYAMRDDDEDEAYFERYARQLGQQLKSDLNPLNLLPIARDIVSIWEGWDVERPDMTLISDIINSGRDLFGEDSDTEDILEFAGALGNATGIPFENIRRDFMGVLNVFSDITDDREAVDVAGAFITGWNGKDDFTMKDRAKRAAARGDNAEVKRIADEMIESKITPEITEKEARGSVRSSFTSTYKKKYIQAAQNRDYNEMNRIRKLLYATGLYGTLSDLDETLEGWRHAG